MSEVIREIDVQGAAALVERGDVAVIEVLPQKYYDAGHLPRAVWSTNQDIARVAAEVARPEGTVLLYCASATCANSHEAARELAQLGYRDLRVFAGGKAAWREAGLPLEVGQPSVSG
jgi:rhodanese-related sulfurtransferase